MDYLSPILFHLFKNREDLISLQQTMYAAYISQLLNPGRDFLPCASYRSVTLIKADVKILPPS